MLTETKRALRALAATSALAVGLAAGAAMAEPPIGKPAPEFTANDSNGAVRRLAELKGKTVVLEWTNHDCPYVGKHYSTGNMQALQKEAVDKGIVWLSVISSAPGQQGHVSGPEANKLTVDRKAGPTAVLLDPDGKIGRLYDARTTPHMYVIDKDGRLAYAGAIDDKPSANRGDVKTARNYVREALAAVADGKPVATATSRPYGCSVKYSTPKS